MSQVAKLFMSGRSQAVRLPVAYRFEGTEIFIRRDPETGDVILSSKPQNWDGFFAALKDCEIPDDFLGSAERDDRASSRDPFDGWDE